jgi:hypothetical protein
MAGNVPNWQAARNGLPGNLDAVNDPNHINQFLGAHPVTPLGYGNAAVSPTSAGQDWDWTTMRTYDWAQQITMSGTAVGRVTVPIAPSGNGADLLVTLCADNGGVPNQMTPLAQTKVPAAVITNLTAPNGLTSAGPLAHPSFNTLAFTNLAISEPWVSPAATVNGAPSYAACVTSGNYSILIGGWDQTGGASTNIVNTAQYLGSGQVAKPIPQPPLPVATFYGAAAATSDTVVYAGGQTNNTTFVSAVWSAGWNANTGTVGAWSSQVALPAAITQGGAASWGGNVYVVGGNTTGSASSSVATVYRSTVTNGQLSNWVQEPSLPLALSYPYVGVVGDWLIVAGGLNSSSTVQTGCYYAPIRADGSLGAWKKGPSLVGASYPVAPGWCTGVTDSALVIYGGAATTTPTNSPYLQVLSANSLGVANAWTAWQMWNTGERATSAFNDGNGAWSVIGYNINNTYLWNSGSETPMLSVPLNATGLTSGNPYWVVFQQYQSGSAADYLSIAFDYQSYPADGQRSPRWSQSWSVFGGSFSIPLTLWDTTAAAQPIHAVGDVAAGPNGTSSVNAGWSHLVYNDTGLLQGVCEVTMEANNPLNANPTFASSVSPWTAVNGTVTQSSAQTHGGYAFSGLLTPAGGFSQAYAQSEFLPVDPGVNELYGQLNWYVASGWLHSPTGWANTSLSVNWYDSGKNLLSTSSATISLAATTWTLAQNYFVCPAGAAWATINPTETGTPGATNLLYLSNVCLTRAPESVPALASVAQITYPTPSQPNAPSWPPTGVVQLA